MREKILKVGFAKFFLGLLIFSCFLNIFGNSVFAQDRGIKLSPTIFEFEVNKGEKIKETFKIDYINFTNPRIDIFYKEFDSEFKISEDSNLFKNFSTLNLLTNSTGTQVDFSIDTSQMSDKTYFFAYQLIFNNIKSSVNINEKIAVTIPIILTVNGSRETANPKPKVILEKSKDIYLNSSDIEIKTQIGNATEKVINFSGELVFLTEKDEVFYTQKVSSEDNRLLPKQIIEQIVNPDFSQLNKKSIPYFGKIKVFYRGIVNNSRHIQTNSLEFYIIPFNLIIFLIMVLIAIIISGILIFLRVKKHKINSKNIIRK